MPLNTTDYRKQHLATGATSFPYPYLFLDNTHLVVTETDLLGVDSIKILNTDYMVTGALNPNGGTVIFLSAPITGHLITIERIAPLTQLWTLVKNGNIDTDVLIQALDKLTMIAQQVSASDSNLSRALKYPTSEPSGSYSMIPSKLARSNKIFGFDEDGNPAVSTSDMSSIDSILPDAQVAASKAQSSAISAAQSATDAATYPIPPWATGQHYLVGRQVRQTGLIYNCDIEHDSGVFADDLEAGKWSNLSSSVSYATPSETAVGTESAKAISPQSSRAVIRDEQGFRLTLVSGVPVTTTDQLAKTTVYFTPYKHNLISLYTDGTWQTFATGELSIGVPATTNTMYDVFAYWTGSAVAIEAVSTTRTTDLPRQDGRVIKSGDGTRRYIGSFKTGSTSGQTECSDKNIFVVNKDNKVLRRMSVTESTANWTYTTFVYRQANANAANQLNFIIGLAEDTIIASCFGAALNSTATPRGFGVGIGLDSTSVNSANHLLQGTSTATMYGTTSAYFSQIISPGSHFLAWLELGTGADILTWSGTDSGLRLSGIVAEFWS